MFKISLPNFRAINWQNIPRFINKHKIAFIVGLVGVITFTGTLGFLSYRKKQAAIEAANNIDWSIKALTLDQLQGGNYYIKDGDTYYQVAPGLMGSTGEAVTIPTQADPNNRMVLFGKDDEQIPTLYKDTKLIYKASDYNNPNADGTVTATPTDYYLERYSDQGYSIGLVGLNNPDGTKFRTSVIQTHFYPDCDALRNLKLKEETELIIDKINGVPITAGNVSTIGSITGLVKDQTYTVDAYIGTSPVGGQVIADTHMFASFELYDIKDYELDAAGYAIINIPDYMWSGYYYINGMGMFRYVNGYKAYGIGADTDYNTPYFMGKDQAGNIITNPAPTVTDPNAITTVSSDQETENTPDEEDPFTYHYKVTIDNQQKSMNISVDYSEAMTYSDTNSDGQYEILKASSGVLIPGAATPQAILVSPSGQKYTMTKMGAIMEGAATSLNEMAENVSAETAEEQAENSLNATIDNPEIGTWNVDITGMYARVFTISTSYAGSSTNMVVKDSSNATNMTVYIPENLADAVFKMTWDEIGHTGVFTVISPENKTVVSNARDNNNAYKYPDGVLNEQYGEVELLVGKAVAGEYKIKITGESLGHVYWNYIDRANGDSSIGEESANANDEAEADTQASDTDDSAASEDSSER